MGKNKELEDFGRRVREFRLQKRLSQQELADRVGYKGKDMISRIESGQTNIPMPKAIEIANALGVKVSDLTGSWKYVEPDRTLPQGGFHGGGVRPDIIPVVEELKELDPSDIARVKAYILALRSVKQWQQLNGMAKDGELGSALMEQLDPSHVRHLEEEEKKMSKGVRERAADLPRSYHSELRGEDTSNK